MGLSEICDLTMALPARAYEESALKTTCRRQRSASARARDCRRSRAFQLVRLAYLWRTVSRFDVVLSQRCCALSERDLACAFAVYRSDDHGLPPVEYFRCRRERGRMVAAARVGG